MLPRFAFGPALRRHAPAVLAGLICAGGLLWFARELDPHYPVREWLIWRLLPIWGYALFFNAACVAFGAFLLRKLLPAQELPALEKLVLGMTLGLTSFVLGLYGLGFLGLFKPWAALLLPGVLLALGASDARLLWAEVVAWRASIPQPRPLERVLGSLAVLAGGAALLFLYLEALDVSAINFDATWYHFPIAQDYAREGRIVPFPGENHRAYPHLTSMLHTWALLVPKLPHLPQHWMLSLHLEFSVVIWRIVGAAALARWLLGGRDVRGLWAGFFLFPSVFIYDQSIGGSADHFLGFFAAAIALLAVRALRRFDLRWCMLLGIALGGHALVKYQSVFLIGASCAAIGLRLAFLCGRYLWRRHKSSLSADDSAPKPLLIGAAAIVIGAVLISSPHFVKNAVYYHNPVYPFAQSVFTASYPKHEPGYYVEQPVKGGFQPRHEGLKRQAWAASKLFTYSFETANRGLTDQRPYMGSLFSLLLPCVLLVPGRRRFVLPLGLLVGSFMLWANSAPNDRYLLSFYDLAIGSTLALLVSVWELGWVARAGLAPLVALQLIWGGDAMYFYGRKQLEAALDLVGSGYAKKFDSSRFAEKSAQVRITQATPPDAVILARNYKGLLGLDRTVYSDIRSAQDLINYSHLKDTREFYELIKSRGVTHLLYPRNQRKPERWNNIILFTELFLHHGKKPKNFGKLWLAELPSDPPPPSQPYLVLVSGIKGYATGIYKLEQLDLDRHPYRVTPAPRPFRELEGMGAADLLTDVRALALRRGRLPSGITKADIQGFEMVESWDGDELHLRRKGAR